MSVSELKVLVVDDEEKIRDLLKVYLEAECYEVAVAGNGESALQKLKEQDFDIVILDLMMPGVDGFSFCREVRRTSDVPIIILSARGDEMDRVLGLELGADDYIVKPFSPRELVARVKAVLRRSGAGGNKENEFLSYHDLTIEPSTRQVRVLGQPVNLTPKEYELLCFLARSPGRVYSREQLLEHVWGYDFFGDVRTVDTHVTRLREKLARVPGAPQYVVTVWGVGYKFKAGE